MFEAQVTRRKWDRISISFTSGNLGLKYFSYSECKANLSL